MDVDMKVKDEVEDRKDRERERDRDRDADRDRERERERERDRDRRDRDKDRERDRERDRDRDRRSRRSDHWEPEDRRNGDVTPLATLPEPFPFSVEEKVWFTPSQVAPFAFALQVSQPFTFAFPQPGP
ncbi:hypothetical protein C8Q78DRAFT_1082383 [Trametes maxima]|nr:hypothetical protein C8Q78DRAFT_1082383 [Trametes maxima]